MFATQIAAVQPVDLGTFTARQLGEHLHHLDLERRKLEAELARTIHHASVTDAHQADGHLTLAAWGRATNRWSTSESGDLVRLATLCGEHPVVINALDHGTIGVAQAHVLARARANPRCGDQLGAFLPIFLDLAEQVSHQQFLAAVRRWESLADQDGSHRSAERTHQRRQARLIEHDDGSISFHAEGGAAQGAQIREVFNRYIDAEFRTDWDACVLEHGNEACAALMPRSPAQRRFDALVKICNDAASTPPDAQSPDPIVHLIADIDTVEDFLRHQTTATAEGEGEPSPHTPGAPDRRSNPAAPWRRCETRDGQPVPVADVIAALIIGRIRVHVVDEHGVILRSGRSRRLFTGMQRTAVLLANTHCIWPGCNRPSSSCQADHLADHQHGGLTDIDNGGPLCGHHNRFKNHGYSVHRDCSGRWHTHRPDGTEI